MGLDIVLYGENRKIIKIVEFKQEVHESIFKENYKYRSYIMLRKLKDYYKTDVIYFEKEINILIDELEESLLYLKNNSHKEFIKNVIKEVSSPSIWKVHVGSD